jgi:hypothetical protein
VSRRRSQLEHELAAIETRHKKRRRQIESSYASWIAELDRLEKAIADGTATRAGAIRSWKRQYPGTRPMTLGEAQLELDKRLRGIDEDYRRELETLEILARLEKGGTPGGAPVRRRARRHRPPDQLSLKTVRRCEAELARRQRARKPKTGPLTLEGIAKRLRAEDPNWNRARVRQAEQLLQVGWPLSRTHPEFSTDEGFVRWPKVEEAARLLRSE